MIKFLLKGLLKDKHRSLLPIIVVTIGVMLTVFMKTWITGILNDAIVMNSYFYTGHVKVMTRAYEKDADQMPNDLALLGADTLLNKLKKDYTEMDWVQRIRFGGLLDFPDAKGETRAQGPAVGWALDLFSKDSKEKSRFNLIESIVQGKYPTKSGEALITSDFAERFKVKPGDTFTLFGTTMDGSMAFKNFTVSGMVKFGSPAIDRGGIIADIHDIQQALGMENAVGEILGYFNTDKYDHDKALKIKEKFNNNYKNSKDEYAPTMIHMVEQGGMVEYMDYVEYMQWIFLTIFVTAMSVVLWNTGLLGGLRRYNEFGVRLAMGEEKKHIYKTLIYEGLLIGIIGSTLGTILGLCVSLYMQEVGIDISGYMENASMIIPSVVRASITPTAFYVGFIPGVVSMVLGNALSGIGIYKRQTAQLFKELEN